MNGGGDKEEEYMCYWWKSRKERDRLEDLDVSGWIMLRWIFREIVCGDMDWIDLAEDTGKCRAHAKTKMYVKVA
jgi:hypothetical protein